jgi:hypothetical protein
VLLWRDFPGRSLVLTGDTTAEDAPPAPVAAALIPGSTHGRKGLKKGKILKTLPQGS